MERNSSIVDACGAAITIETQSDSFLYNFPDRPLDAAQHVEDEMRVRKADRAAAYSSGTGGLVAGDFVLCGFAAADQRSYHR